MPKSLVEEAIADAQGLKDLAEDRAKRALLEMVTPKLKQLIDSHLLGEVVDDDVEVETPEKIEEAVTSAKPAAKEGGEFVMSNESLKALAPVIRSQTSAGALLEAEVATLGESVVRACSKNVSGDVLKLLSRIEHTYSRVRESVSLGPKRKEQLCSKLEELNSELNESFKETIEMRDKKNLREADEMPGAGEEPAMDPSAAGGEPSAETAPEGEDVVITLKGLKDVDAETLNVDVKVDTEEEEAGAEDGMGEEGAEGDEDLFGGEEGGATAPPAKTESRARSNKEIVYEISGSDLKREMKRMRINESDTDAGKKIPKGGKIPVDDFGGGHDDGDPWLDHDVTVAEGVDDMNEEEEMDESEEMEEGDGALGVTETQLRRREDTYGSKLANDHDTMIELALSEEEEMTEGEDEMDESEEMEESEQMAYENLKRQFVSARKVYSETVKRFNALKASAQKYAGTTKGKQYRTAALKENSKVKQCGERVTKLSEQLRKASASLKEGSNKSVPSTQNTKQVAALKNELARVQLENRKILCATKLLQTEGMTSAKKNAIIDALDAAKSLQEVKAIYSKLAKKLAGGNTTGSVNESVEKTGSTRGSASRAGKTSGSSQTLNESADAESIETNRWAVLAGLPSQK